MSPSPRPQVNVPLRDGMDDASYHGLFRPIMAEVVARFQPEAVVLQSGARGCRGRRMGCLAMRGGNEPVALPWVGIDPQGPIVASDPGLHRTAWF